MKYLSDREARLAILEIGKRMDGRHYVVANDGNISVKVAEDTLWITPSGVSKGTMKEEGLLKINLDGDILEGDGRYSSEANMHLCIYRADREVGCVCHAHPPMATAFAIAGLDLDAAILPEAIVSLGTVPVVPYATPGSPDVGESIVPYVASHNAVMLANHGVTTWGGIPEEAMGRLETVEHYAQVCLYTHFVIGKANYFPEEEVETLIATRSKWGFTKGGTPKGGDAADFTMGSLRDYTPGRRQKG